MPLQGPFRGRVERGGAVWRLRRGGHRLAVGDHGRRGDVARGDAAHGPDAGAVPLRADDDVGSGVDHHQAGGGDRGDLGNLHDSSSSSVRRECIESILTITFIRTNANVRNKRAIHVRVAIY